MLIISILYDLNSHETCQKVSAFRSEKVHALFKSCHNPFRLSIIELKQHLAVLSTVFSAISQRNDAIASCLEISTSNPFRKELFQTAFEISLTKVSSCLSLFPFVSLFYCNLCLVYLLLLILLYASTPSVRIIAMDEYRLRYGFKRSVGTMSQIITSKEPASRQLKEVFC